MYAQAFKNLPYIPMVIAGMVLFFSAFAAIFFMTFNKRSNHNEAAELPLKDEEFSHVGK